jgi:hypothetical protein
MKIDMNIYHQQAASSGRCSGRRGRSSRRRRGHEPAAREDSLSHGCITREEKEKKKGTLHWRRALLAATEIGVAALGVYGARAHEGMMRVQKGRARAQAQP